MIALVLAGACSAPEATGPSNDSPQVPFGTGTAGGSTVDASSAVVGSWQRFDVLTADSSADLITQTTAWTFDASGFCRRTITTFDAVEGIPRGTQRDCSYTLGLQEITLTWSDDSTQTFSLTFAGFDPDRLVLDGLEYRRVS